MIIQFNHDGNFLKAELIYNFKQIKNTVLLKHSINTEIKEEILFYQNKCGWYSESGLQERFPSTYKSISKAIIENFRTEELFGEVYAQMYLS